MKWPMKRRASAALNFTSVSAALPGVYRLVSPVLTTGAKHASLNDNSTFVTNIPSLDFALRIWRTRWLFGIAGLTASGGDFAAGSTSIDVQFFAQLTENQTKTSIVSTDTSYLDSAWQQFLFENQQATAVGLETEILPIPMEVIHDFPPWLTPFTVATKLNIIASMVENTSAFGTGLIFKPTVTIEYTLERLTPDLRDYLAKRLQIQGS